VKTDCLRCNNQRYRVVVRGDLTVAEPCPACAAECPICHDDGTTSRLDARGYEVLVPCTCQHLKNRLGAFNGARIPARYQHCALATYEPLGSAQTEAFHRVARHLDRFVPGGHGLLLTGPVGTGKTHLLVSILRDLALEKGLRVRFVEFTHLLADIKEGFSQGRSEGDVLGPVTRVTVLAVDELGKGLISDWQVSILDEVISRRYNAGLTTYFTTNLPTGETTPRLDEPVAPTSGSLRRSLEQVQLVDRVGERIFSRLHEMCETVPVSGPDYRRR
jgi:DNA replication protein DnaC